MSRSHKSNNEDNNKIFRDPSVKSLESTVRTTSAEINNRFEKLCAPAPKTGKPIVNSQSDGSILKHHDHTGLKQKLVNRVKLWSHKDGKEALHGESSNLRKPEVNLTNVTMNLENLNLSNDASDDVIYKSDLVKAKDSLENLLGSRSERIVNSKSYPHPSTSQAKEISSENPVSEPSLGSAGSSSNSSSNPGTSKILTWDPWNKLGRKNRKENKRRKREKTPTAPKEFSRHGSPKKKNRDHTLPVEPRTSIGEPANEDSHNLLHLEDNMESYEYSPYDRQQKKSVEFVNEVLVVHFTGDDTITKSTEPLKKELEQQIRNKEMRRGHIPCTMMMGKKAFGDEDYMASWFKK